MHIGKGVLIAKLILFFEGSRKALEMPECHTGSLPATHVQLRIETLRRSGFVQCVNVQDNATLVRINYLGTDALCRGRGLGANEIAI